MHPFLHLSTVCLGAALITLGKLNLHKQVDKVLNLICVVADWVAAQRCLNGLLTLVPTLHILLSMFIWQLASEDQVQFTSICIYLKLLFHSSMFCCVCQMWVIKCSSIWGQYSDSIMPNISYQQLSEKKGKGNKEQIDGRNSLVDLH